MFVDTWDKGIVVHSAVVRKLVKLLKELGLDVVIGEGAALGVKSWPAFEKAGYVKLAAELGVPLYDFALPECQNSGG